MKSWIGALGLAFALVIVLLGVSVVDHAVTDRSFMTEGPPVYSMYFALRMGLAVIISTVVAMLALVWNGGILFRRLEPPRRGFSFLFALVCLLGCVGFSALMMQRPRLFDWLAIEDSYIEWSSAVILLSASALMLMTCVQLLKSGKPRIAVLSLLAAVVLFIVGMEEISWMQRVIGFRTPEYLRTANMQREANFHNLATELSENLYYGGGFLLLVLSPSMAFLFRAGGPLAVFAPFLPSRYALLVGALGTAFAQEMWNIFWIQIAFFYACLLLGLLAAQALRLRIWSDALLFGCGALALVACHLVSLHMGAELRREWADTEYKEHVLAAGLLLFAAEAFLRTRVKSWRLAAAGEAA